MTAHLSCINLKCSLARNQVEDRLKYHPHIVELQLFERDIAAPHEIRETTGYLRSRGVKVYLHHPMTVSGKFLDILSPDPGVAEFYRESCAVLDQICREEDLFCVVHPHYVKCESGQVNPADENGLVRRSQELAQAIQALRATTGDRFLWENSPVGLFSSQNRRWISDIVRPLDLPVCYDISHAFMGVRGNHRKLEQDLDSAFPYTRYYHVVDSAGGEVHDALSLGEGGIDWVRLKPYILQRDFIFEIDLKDYTDCRPMVRSAEYFQSLQA